MANNKIVTLFPDVAETYLAYTSQIVYPNEGAAGFHLNALIQVELDSGSVTIQGRVNDDAPWVTLKAYTAGGMDYLHVAPEMQVISNGQAKVWLAETR